MNIFEERDSIQVGAAHPDPIQPEATSDSQVDSASVRRPALASRPDTGRPVTPAPCRQIERNGPGVLPPPAPRALRPGKEIPHNEHCAGSAPCWTRDEGARARAGRKPSEGGEAAAREAHPPSSATAVFARGSSTYVDRGERRSARIWRAAYASREMGSLGVGSTQKNDTQIRGGEGGRAGGGGRAGTIETKGSYVTNVTERGVRRERGSEEGGRGAERQEKFGGEKECDGKGAQGKPGSRRMRLGMESILQARREYKRLMRRARGRTR
ncbi:hypothetical protein DFH09DRAFT_1084479 [Mycena vulgaris]|nr:hypothetical protein DFH09DRAFT_1084479 [Mycena vulgaris]